MQTSSAKLVQLRFWALGMVISGSFWIALQGFASLGEVIAGLGLALLLCPFKQGFYKGMVFCLGFLIAGSIAWILYYSIVEPAVIQQVYFISSGIFYSAFIFFLLKKENKEAFRFPISEQLAQISPDESGKIKAAVKMSAAFFLFQGITSYVLADWFRARGIPPGDIVSTVVYILAAMGLLWLKPNAGRRVSIFICFVAMIGYINSFFWKSVSLYGYVYLGVNVLALGIIGFFLFNPKTKAVFK